ncbi:hypothetical protein NE237_002466 [Protea cynaroides]|uniref:Uncharacterized protein n=1 Tax=Protea cynaroides TaxID=273540 RepID=A0A9Q0KV88_9MAGN|nr:hypothetical protein NE237_002466 [Protea cynaroides]
MMLYDVFTLSAWTSVGTTFLVESLFGKLKFLFSRFELFLGLIQNLFGELKLLDLLFKYPQLVFSTYAKMSHLIVKLVKLDDALVQTFSYNSDFQKVGMIFVPSILRSLSSKPQLTHFLGLICLKLIQSYSNNVPFFFDLRELSVQLFISCRNVGPFLKL